MIRFYVLGGIELRDSHGREIRAVLAQPKRLALLAYLAIAGRESTARRDTLLGLFWPELDQERARQALNKAVHFLRQSLGEAAIVSRSAEEIALDSARCWSDVNAFDAAVDAKQFADALSLYRGDLLPAFYVRDALGFEPWLERERARLRDRAAEVARRLAEQHEAARHLTLAVSCARRAVELSGDDERTFRRLLSLLARLGDRGGAVHAYEDFAKRLASEYDAEPSGETVALIDQIRTRDNDPPARAIGAASVAMDFRDQLQATLGGSFTLERELGSGRMSRVFVANERALGRKVVIKVLSPELAADVNVERFRREIHIAARLQHPHIVALHTAGVSAGLPYYTMPYIEGESLRAHLDQSGGTLTVNEAVRILREVADGLAYAHEQGVVHRDIKPENVLLTKQHALVADFGVAKALWESTTGLKSPSSRGIVFGTPAYMAPEQVASDPRLDHRADIYAFGVLAYELLTGRPPFADGSPHELLSAHIARQPELVSDRRADLPPALSSLVMRCLEKDPAHRPQSAGEIRRVLDVLAAASGGRSAVGWTLPFRFGRRRAVGATIAAIVVAIVSVRAALAYRRTPVAVSGDVVAVAPFRIAGADPSLAYLREGVIDLLAAKLTGEGGPRAAEPRATLAAWRQAAGAAERELPESTAVRLATGLGAGRLILGSIVGTPQRLVITASLLDSRGQRTRADVSVDGPADSLAWLVDRLTAKLLTASAGEDVQRGLALSTVALPALRAYLDGQVAYRRAEYSVASAHFERALQVDSGFALAALGLVTSSEWTATSDWDQLVRARKAAWALRDRLSTRDRAFLFAIAGPRVGTIPAYREPGREILAAREISVQMAPERVEAWFELGDWIYHRGWVFGIEDAHDRAAAAFRRVMKLDSTFAPALEHLVDLSARSGDTAQVRLMSRRYFAVASAADHRDYVRWRAATALGDTATLTAVRQRMPQMDLETALRIVGFAEIDGVNLDDAERVLKAAIDRATTNDQLWAYHRLSILERNRGRLRNARALEAERKKLETPSPLLNGLRDIEHALFWDDDMARGEAAARALTAIAGRPPPPAGSSDSAVRTHAVDAYGAANAVMEWSLLRGDTAAARHLLEIARRVTPALQRAREVDGEPVLIALGEAGLAVLGKRHDAGRHLEHLDSLMKIDPDEFGGDASTNLVVARLFEQHGDLRHALSVTRRTMYFFRGTRLLSAYLRERGRLAALVGEADEAIRAYRHYLTLRSNADPELAPHLAIVRSELTRLEAQQRRARASRAG